jgi:hypothetical protein
LPSLQVISEFEIMFSYVVWNTKIQVNLFKVAELFCASRQRPLRLLSTQLEGNASVYADI